MAIALTAVLSLLCIFAAAYIFMIMPRVTDRADMDLISTDYAHRGLWNARYPENSLPAFELAARGGYGIELDVRLSADGEVIVFHDAGLERMCGVRKRVEALTAAELCGLQLAGTQYTVPRLSEVLALVDGRVPLLIELKGEGKEEALCQRTAELLDTYGGAFAVQSFSPLVLSWFKKYRPRFARGQLVTKIREVKGVKHSRLVGVLLSGMLLNVLSRPDFISVNGNRIKSVPFRICVLLFKCKGLVWTVRSDKQYARVRGLGLLAIFEKIIP